jgi:hypothetical protein
VFVALSWSKHPAPQTFEEAADKMWKTSESWRQWINIGDFPDHPWRPTLQCADAQGLTISTGQFCCSRNTATGTTLRLGTRLTFALWASTR